LLADDSSERIVAWRDGLPVYAPDFLADVQRIANLLPAAGHAINLCEDRYAFIASFCAVACRGQTTLLPPSRAPQAVDEALAAHMDAYALSDVPLVPAPQPLILLPELGGRDSVATTTMPGIGGEQIVAIGFTSGSTGQPKPNPKTWDNFRLSTGFNTTALAETLGLAPGEIAHIVATVPAQHMYGMEMSVLLPLFGPFAVHAGKPFFPADIASALAAVPAPRLLVTTPVHLRTLLRENIDLPPIAAIASATAPLPAELAAQAEARYGAPLIEMFGSTETCVIASRRTARETDWRLHESVELRPQPDGTLVSAAHLPKPVQLQDVVELLPERRFRLCGRNSDLLEIAGKRASLADLTRRLSSLDGVLDAVVFQLDGEGACVQRIAALVVAPARKETDLLAELRRAIDPVFLPRPLKRVERLPRNETGKLPRTALLAAFDEKST
jgi:acyl-coenzyme A synthetase/AMP-(fatty) acid ligase